LVIAHDSRPSAAEEHKFTAERRLRVDACPSVEKGANYVAAPLSGMDSPSNPLPIRGEKGKDPSARVGNGLIQQPQVQA